MVYYWYIKKIGFKWKEGVEGYRLRVGNFRVLFDVNGVIIDIIDIGNRGQIYKGVWSICLLLKKEF